MRKNKLLIAVAAAALAAGSGTAFAQGAPKQGGHMSDSPAVQSNPAAKNAPAERIAPSPSAKSGGAERVQGAERKAGPANRMGEANHRNKAKSETTGQAPNQMQNQPEQKAGPKSDRLNSNAQKSNEPDRTNSGQVKQRNGAGERNTMENRGSASASTSVNVNLNAEQKTKIHTIIVGERSAPRVARVDFDVHVGTVVPRGRVKLVPLPATIVEIEPTWRGYEYFLVGDEIVVVDPATLRIVAVLPA